MITRLTSFSGLFRKLPNTKCSPSKPKGSILIIPYHIPQNCKLDKNLRIINFILHLPGRSGRKLFRNLLINYQNFQSTQLCNEFFIRINTTQDKKSTCSSNLIYNINNNKKELIKTLCVQQCTCR